MQNTGMNAKKQFLNTNVLRIRSERGTDDYAHFQLFHFVLGHHKGHCVQKRIRDAGAKNFLSSDFPEL